MSDGLDLMPEGEADDLPLPPPAEEEDADEPGLDDEPYRACTPTPEVPNPDSVSMERCFELTLALGKAHPNPGEAVAFDPACGLVLWALLCRPHAPADGDQAVRVTQAGIAGACGISRKQVRSRFWLLAQFGLIQVVSQAEAPGMFAAGNVYFNPLMVQLVLKRGGRKLSQSATGPFMEMGLSRDQSVRRPQGWRGFDVEFGEREPSPGTAAQAGKQLAPWAKALGSELEALEAAAGAVNAITASKRMRAQERIRRAAMAEAFVSGCATVWQQAHERRGYGGTGRPAWEGPFEGLSPENKKQFRELRQLFEKFGGKRVAMAWAVFANYQPVTDERGRLKFDPALPHVQWVSSDKKPSHFAKHFDALQLDPVVRERAADEGACARIEAIIGPPFRADPAEALPVAAAKIRGGRS